MYYKVMNAAEDDMELIDRVKIALRPYKKAWGRLRVDQGKQKGISFQTGSSTYDPTYNVHWPTLAAVKIGVDEEYDSVELLGEILNGLAQRFGRRLSREVGKDFTRMVIR